MDIDIRPYDPARKPELLELLRLCLGEGPGRERDAAWWDWRHERNPFGPSLILTAEVQGKIVGLRPFLRWQLLSGEEPIRAVKPIDTVTHPDYRRLGIFSRLTTAALEQARQEGVQMLFNTPNRNSLPGYLKLGWQRVARLPVCIKVLRPLAGAVRAAWSLLRGSGTDVAEKEIRVDSPRAAELFRDAAAIAELVAPWWGNGEVRTPRTAEFLRWRYAEHPHADYFVEAEDAGGRLVAAAVFRSRFRRGLRELMLDDLFLREHDSAAVGRLLKRIACATDADYIVAHFPAASPVRRMLAACGFRDVPGKCIELVARGLGSTETAGWRCESWALTLADIEGL